MTSTSPSLWRDVTIVNELGLHLRSATKVAQAASSAVGAIWLEKGDQRVDAKDAIDILTLGGTQGTALRIGVAEPDDERVLETIVGLFTDGFGE